MYKYLPLFLLATGCGSTIVPVQGLLTKGLDPVGGVMVSLNPTDSSSAASVAYGGTDTEGKFTLYTLPDKGVQPGQYIVTLQPPTDGPASKQVPSKFTNVRESPWRVTIPSAGIAQLHLDVAKDKVQHPE